MIFEKKRMKMKTFFTLTAAAALMLCAFMIIASADVMAADNYYKGRGTSSSPYKLSSAADLYHLAAKVNKGTTYKGKYFRVTRNIDLKSRAWTPIGGKDNGSGSAKYKFRGNFNGNNKTISGLHVSVQAGYCGLFGYNLGTVKSFTLKGSVTCTPAKDAGYIGGVVGFNAGTVRNVTSYVRVKAGTSSRTVCAVNIGGIAGFNTSGRYVWYDGTKDRQATVSGAKGIITACTNKGTITGERRIGGIAGENAGVISRCGNTAGVYTTFSTSSKRGSGSGGGYGNGYGGIAGRNGNNNTAYETGTITDCYNTGEIGPYTGTDSRWYGGITGFQNNYSSITNCYTTGTLRAGYEDWYPAAGRQDPAAKVTNTYSLDTIASASDASAEEKYCGIRKTADEMKTETFAALLGGAFRTDTAGINGGYPVLK